MVDDDDAVRDVITVVLKRAGHLVIDAVNGREGLAVANSMPLDLVITDIKMEDMDGIDAAREICRAEALPIILVSSYHDAELIERAQVDYVLGYLIKPVRKADLETAVAIAMRRFEEYQVLRMEADHYRQWFADHGYADIVMPSKVIWTCPPSTAVTDSPPLL